MWLIKLKAAIKTFCKAQVSAFFGGLLDFGCMVFLTEILGWFYVYGIFAGGILGALLNFVLNRYWAFGAQNQSSGAQLLKFAMVVVGSITLKSGGTVILTEWAGLDYRFARLCTDAIVAFGFNYVLQRYWVFRSSASVSPSFTS